MAELDQARNIYGLAFTNFKRARQEQILRALHRINKEFAHTDNKTLTARKAARLMKAAHAEGAIAMAV